MFRSLRIVPTWSRANIHSTAHTLGGAQPQRVEAPEALAFNSEFPGPCHYRQLYDESIVNPNAFWTSIAAQLHFEHVSGKGLEYNFDHRKGKVFTKFMDGSITNVAYNCLERNILMGKIHFLSQSYAIQISFQVLVIKLPTSGKATPTVIIKASLTVNSVKR